MVGNVWTRPHRLLRILRHSRSLPNLGGVCGLEGAEQMPSTFDTLGLETRPSQVLLQDQDLENLDDTILKATLAVARAGALAAQAR